MTIKKMIENTIEDYLIEKGQEKSSAHKEAQELAHLVYTKLLRYKTLVERLKNRFKKGR